MFLEIHVAALLSRSLSNATVHSSARQMLLMVRNRSERKPSLSLIERDQMIGISACKGLSIALKEFAINYKLFPSCIVTFPQVRSTRCKAEPMGCAVFSQ